MFLLGWLIRHLRRSRLACSNFILTLLTRKELRSEATVDFMKDIKDSIACPYSLTCTSSALGHGVDKRHVRLVVQWEAPADIEAYIQAAGRAVVVTFVFEVCIFIYVVVNNK